MEKERLSRSPEAEKIKEAPYIDPSIVGLQLRLLADGEYLDPETKMNVSDILFNPRGTLEKIREVSYEERKDFYESNYKDLKYDDRMRVWREKFTGFINEKTSSLSGKEKKQWVDFCNGYGLSLSGEQMNQADAQGFYERYFPEKEGKRISDVDKFVDDGLKTYIVGERLAHKGPGEDIEKKKQWIEEIGKWSLGDVSGSLASSFTDAIAIYQDEEAREQLANNVKGEAEDDFRANRLSDKEKKLLEKFSPLKRKEEVVPQRKMAAPVKEDATQEEEAIFPAPQESSYKEEKEEPYFRAAGKSEASEEHPERNEDNILQMPEHGVFAVFDGMSRPAGGEVAAEIASDYLKAAVKTLKGDLSYEETNLALNAILEKADRRIKQEARRRGLGRIGTTASVVRLWKEGDETRAVIVNVGDSRVYVLLSNGQLAQLTIDDNYLKQVFGNTSSAKKYQERLNNIKDKTELEGETIKVESLGLEIKLETVFDKRNMLTKTLGSGFFEPSISPEMDLSRGIEKIILTSDGIHDNLTDFEIQEILMNNRKREPLHTVEELIKAAKNRSHEDTLRSKPDDMSAIIIDIL